jgi:hypothetical protein
MMRKMGTIWEDDKQIILEKHFEVINSNNLLLFGTLKDYIVEINPILPLIEFIISRIETVTSLIINDILWDAEIILRSALETFIKLLFITTSSGEEMEKRIHEYWYSLAEINSLAMSEQGKRNLKCFGNIELHKLAFLPLILSDENEKLLRDKWSHKKRHELEQKWSFSEMLKSISNSYNGQPMEMLLALTHSYRMSSHVMHGDELGISIIKERDNRTQEERDKADRGHFLRLISDCCTYCAFVGNESMNFLGLQDKRIIFLKSMRNLDSIQDIIAKYSGKVFEDTDYDKYR